MPSEFKEAENFFDRIKRKTEVLRISFGKKKQIVKLYRLDQLLEQAFADEEVAQYQDYYGVGFLWHDSWGNNQGENLRYTPSTGFQKGYAGSWHPVSYIDIVELAKKGGVNTDYILQHFFQNADHYNNLTVAKSWYQKAQELAKEPVLHSEVAAIGSIISGNQKKVHQLLEQERKNF